MTAPASSSTPVITELRVIPVAGRDSMLLNLSGAHGPFFTRNMLILTDSSGNTGVGEVPGGEKIRQTLEDARELIVGQPLGSQQRLVQEVQQKFADRDSGGRGLQTFDLRIAIHAVTAIESALHDWFTLGRCAEIHRIHASSTFVDYWCFVHGMPMKRLLAPVACTA